MSKEKTIFEYEPNPIEKNIEFAFQKLIFSVTASANYNCYKETENEWKDILKIINKWLNIYVNTKNLSKINPKEFNIIQEKLFELDSKYLQESSLYAEDAYEWIIQLKILLEKISKH